MKIIIEFPMLILESYHGPANLDVTLDDNISYLLRTAFIERGIDSRIVKLDFIAAQPESHDALVQYEMEIFLQDPGFNPQWIIDKLKREGYEEGLTIRDSWGNCLYAHPATADIQLRRKQQKKKG